MTAAKKVNGTKIKDRYGVVLYSSGKATVCEAVEEAVAADLDLHGANLTGAHLAGAQLTGADLTGANLSWANLRWANLFGANLTGANLFGAELRGAYLHGADLRRAIGGQFVWIPDIGGDAA